MAEDMGERTEEATPKRRQEARDEGNIAKSADMAGALKLLGVVGMLWLGAMPMLGELKRLVQTSLDGSAWNDTLHGADVLPLAAVAGWSAVRAVVPLLLVAWALSYVSYVWQVGFLISGKAVQPQLSRLDPIKGAGRVLGKRALAKAGIDSLKVAATGTVGAMAIWQLVPRMVVLPQLTPMAALASVGDMMMIVALKILVVLLVVGVLDLVWQRWKHDQDLRMTRQQVRDEMKQNEGDPEVKRRRMRMAQQIAMQRVATAVPKADVIVTNPEHLSVAIAYDSESMLAPRVVALGADHLALRIRQIATSHGIPIVERKPLARALYRECEVGQEVPPAHYQAVAEILAYVYRLNDMAGERATA